MLAVHVERERLAAVLAAFSKPASTTDQPRVEVVSVQDYDSEERGIMRDGVTDNGDVEMQPMDARNDGPSTQQNEAGADAGLERSRLLDEPPPRDETEDDDSPLDKFWSGTAIVADFHVLATLRKQWDDYGNATGGALGTNMPTVGFSAEFAAVTANRRINAATASFARGVESLSV